MLLKLGCKVCIDVVERHGGESAHELSLMALACFWTIVIAMHLILIASCHAYMLINSYCGMFRQSSHLIALGQ